MPLLEGDTVTLRCRGWGNNPVTRVRFYTDKKDLAWFQRGTELSLFPLEVQHSGRYRCKGIMGSQEARSAPVTVTVHGEHPTAGSPISRHPHSHCSVHR